MTDWTLQDLMAWRDSNSTTKPRTVPKPRNQPCDYETFANQLLKKCRLFSQLIATSWLDGDKAKQIRDIFTKATGPDDSEFRDLCTGRKPELWAQSIFDDDEIDLYRFKISWDSFEGALIEHAQAIKAQTPPYFTMTVPYPPRPVLGEFTVTYEQIEKWATSKEESNEGLLSNPFPPYPYIPMSSC
jgi:hypothetical protein